MKILLLGSSSVASVDIVKKAHELGHYVIVTDNIGMTLAKELADKIWNISTADIKKLKELCIEEQVDGIISAVSEFNWEQAIKLSDSLGLRVCTKKHVWQSFNDKIEFKKNAQKYGIPTTENFLSTDDIQNFPVIVKPVDNCGARGIGISTDKSTLALAVEEALQFSKKKKCVIEKYYEGEEISIYGTIVNKKFICSAVIDRKVIFEPNMPSPKATLLKYPSKWWSFFEDGYLESFQNFVDAMKIEFGVCFFQGIVSKNRLYIYEGEMRLSSSQLYNIIDYYQGYNRIELMLEYVLYGKVKDTFWKGRGADFFGGYAYVINPILKSGTIKRIEDEKLLGKDWIIKYERYVDEGDMIPQFDKSGIKFFGCIHVIADNEQILESRLDYIKRNLIVNNCRRESLIII